MNRVTYLLINNARTAFCKDFVEKNSGDQGKLFRATKGLLKQDSGVQFPPHDDECLLANAMISSSSRKYLIFGWIMILLPEVLLDPQNMTLIVL